MAVIQETPNTSMATPLTNITALSPATGSGTASAAEGRASGKTQSVPASSSRRGLQRIISSAPHSVPTPNVASAKPQGRAPPSSSLATSGPYTDSAAPTTATTTENCATMDHSQGRPMNSCQPSRRSESSPPPGARDGM